MASTDIIVPQWIKHMPKVELHAHLSGSIPPDTLLHLLAQHKKQPNFDAILATADGLLDVSSGRTLRQCFELFPVIHALIHNSDALRFVVSRVLQHFANDNVIYLELRTTPRETPQMTVEQYLSTVVETVDMFQKSSPSTTIMACRIIVSISRHLPLFEAEHIVNILQRWWEEFVPNSAARRIIVGIELSGNPNNGEWLDFKPLFQRIRQNINLPVSLHFAEISNDTEALQMLAFQPDRLGHAAVMSPAVRKVLVNTGIPVEVCLTSNLITRSVESAQTHPAITHLIPAGHPVCICTDDCGVFDTTLSREFAMLSAFTELSRDEIWQISRNSLEMTFCRDEQVLAQLRLKLDEQ